MLICAWTLNIIRALVTIIIAIVRTIVETVCELITTVITTIKEVVKEVCSWLPWPLDLLCDLVVTLVEVVETFTEWVCEEVITFIFDFIETVVEYIFYILKWVCWVIDWPLRFITDVLPCLLGIKLRKHIDICVKVLTSADESPSEAMSLSEVERLIRETRARYEQCNITINVLSITFIEKPEHFDVGECGFSSLFTASHIWFNKNRCKQKLFTVASPMTIYVIRDMAGVKGCSIPGNEYVIIDREASNATMAHEMGHSMGPLGHSDTATNVMFTPSSDDSRDFTSGQCCLVRSSRFASYFPPIGRSTVDIAGGREP